MGKLRAVKKSRGHYAAKKHGLDVHDSVQTSGLEAITLHTKEQSFSASKNKNSSEKLSIVPITNERLKEGNASLSIKCPESTKKGISKKDKRIARRQQWMKKLSNFHPADDKTVKEDIPKVDNMQSLIDALPSLQEVGQNKKKVQKSTKKTLAAEIKNFVEVLEHPAFKKDPLGTIHLHLTNARKRGLI